MHLTFFKHLCIYLVLTLFPIAITQPLPDSTTIEPPTNQTPSSTPPETSPIITTETTTAPLSPITNPITPETPITPDPSPSPASPITHNETTTTPAPPIIQTPPPITDPLPPVTTEPRVSKHHFHITTHIPSIAHSPHPMQTILLLRPILTKMHIQRFLPNLPNGSLRNPNTQFMFRISKCLWYWWWCNILFILFNNPAIRTKRSIPNIKLHNPPM